MNDLDRLQRKIDLLDERIKEKDLPPVIGTVPDSRPLYSVDVKGWPEPADGAETPSAPAPYTMTRMVCVVCRKTAIEAIAFPGQYFVCAFCSR